MRKWTQFIKQQISERVKKDEEATYKLELVKQNRSSLNSKSVNQDQISEQQKEVLKARIMQKEDEAVNLAFEEVVNKAKFLVKLQVPKVFLEASQAIQKEEENERRGGDAQAAPSQSSARQTTRFLHSNNAGMNLVRRQQD